jgi:hypothetical protein
MDDERERGDELPPWPEPNYGPGFADPLYESQMAASALVRLAMAREWIDDVGCPDWCGFVAGETVYRCTCGRVNLLQILKVPK